VSARSTLQAAATRGAPPRRLVVRAVAAGAAAQLASVALLGLATGLFVRAATRPGLSAVFGLLLAVELLAFARAPLRHAERLAAHDLGLDGLAGWRTWLLDAVASWSPSRLAAARAGDLLARCLDDADRLQDLWVRSVVPAAASTVALVVASIPIAILAPWAGLAVFGATLVVAGSTFERAERVAALGVAEARLRGEVAARGVEFARAGAQLRLLGADDAHLRETAARLSEADRLAARRDGAVARLGLLGAGAGVVALLVAVGTAPLPSAHPAVAAGVVLATLACGELLALIPDSLEGLGPVAGAAARLGALAVPHADGTDAARRGPLQLTAVDVAPSEVGPVLLADVVLDVAPGERVAVVGPTGVGKSSLLAVAAALEPPRRGVVRLDGTSVASLSEATLRRRLAWQPAHPTLLEGRVRDVLDVGRGLDDEALGGALRAVGLEAVLAARGGLDAELGERGEDLSGGERRRLALARLLAGAPDLYLLDEPTAGLDANAKGALLAALAATGAGVLVATHDPAVAAFADARHEVRDGRVQPADGARVSR
jgi:ABC-type transport system involved in cytochrome bd biosynthesis fused ATPase/permease subunit